MKKSGKPQQKSKEELLELMNYYLDLQIDIAKEQEEMYRLVESGEVEDCGKHKNSYQNNLNNQIDAIIRTCGALIRIDGSKLETKDNEETDKPKKKGLLD